MEPHIFNELSEAELTDLRAALCTQVLGAESVCDQVKEKCNFSAAEALIFDIKCLPEVSADAKKLFVAVSAADPESADG